MNDLNKLHIGRMIKQIASDKHISSPKLADAIGLYQGNSSKIFEKDDLDVVDLIRISDILEVNLLDLISKQFLSHLPCVRVRQESYVIKFNKLTKRYDIKGNAGSRVFLDKIDFGDYLQKIAQKNRWNEQTMGKRLGLDQPRISRLYKRKRINIKELIRFSNALGQNLIAEVYLAPMWLAPLRYPIEDCEITIEENEIRLENPTDPTFLMEYHRKNN